MVTDEADTPAEWDPLPPHRSKAPRSLSQDAIRKRKETFQRENCGGYGRISSSPSCLLKAIFLKVYIRPARPLSM